MSARDWKSIQRRLTTLGYTPGPIDGVWGAKTDAAVRAFQRRAGLVVDGVVGSQTYRALFGNRRPHAMSVMTAAHMAAAAYKLHPRHATAGDTLIKTTYGLHVTKRCTKPGVEAYMLNNRCLLIPGSNSLNDYLRFNLRLWGVGKRKLSFRQEAKRQKVDTRTRLGFSRTVWHQGFFQHANKIRTWIGDDPNDWPTMIIGHSLGAASAQILSKTWATPAIGFAAPRPRKSNGPIALEELSLSICRDDDIVCFLPSSFHRMGQTSILRHKSPRGGLNHNMDAYIDALNNRKPNLGIPTTWNP
ncbi:peptidoglycan-binding protein [uncultured Tateyamaria sp.]|uniref:peptidoglycan-binding protein n=1 Tax=uncultured Tateyamaria sp. TaxID=455651 RepID=UPI0026025F7B|nr:peptidoglycan-binding protein [uncultured Tateyamaria sp.]